MKKIFALLIASSFFIACNNNSGSDKDVNRDSVQTTSHDSTITKPATTDTSAKSMGKDSTKSSNPSK